MGIRKTLLVGLLGLAPALRAQDNVLIVIADDIGVDHLTSYGVGSDLPPTPTLDALAAGGVLFRNAYSQPVCSPTRAQVLTGRHAFRNGIGHIVGPGMVAPPLTSLPLSEITLPEMLDLGSGGLFSHAAFGKWHLHDGVGFETAPNDAGFSHFSGTPANLGFDPTGYFIWVKVIDGSVSVSTNYITTDQVDDALAWIVSAPEPWLCYLSFSAAHHPMHAPPPNLHTQDLSGAGTPGADPRPYYKAIIESLDTELGRLLAGMGTLVDRTNVFFLGDNGSVNEAVVPPFDPSHAKTTLYEGGVNVPFIVSGPAVAQPGTECKALVGMTDLFATVAELAGIDMPSILPVNYELDSISLLPYLQNPSTASRRGTVFAQIFGPLGSGPHSLDASMIRDERYKLIRVFTPGVVGYPAEFYDLKLDRFELNDLLSGPGLTAVELDALRRLDREGYELVHRATPAGPSASQNHITLASNAPSGGGLASSTNYRLTSQVGLPVAAPAVASTGYHAEGGVSWLTGGFRADRPLVFGMTPNRGQKAGGYLVDLFGAGLDRLTTSAVVDLALGGQAIQHHQVIGPSHLRIVMPTGSGAFGNPIGSTLFDLVSDDGLLLSPGLFTFTPAIDQSGPARVGGNLPLHFSMAPGDTYFLAFGFALQGVALPVPPFEGALELTALIRPAVGPAVSAGGEEDFLFALPVTTSLIGATVDFQGLALQGASNGGFTNRVRVRIEPPY